MPIPNYDRQLLGQYIRSLENPDSIGFRDGKWYASPYDKNARGFGVDIVANKAAAKVVAGRPGRYLTEQEERDLRNAYIQTTQGTIDRQYHPYLRKQPLSDSKRIMATGLLYRGDSINMDKALSDAYYNGTDEDFQEAVTDYYKRKKLPERAKHHSKFFNKKQEVSASIKKPEPPHVTQSFESMQYQPPMKFSDGGFLHPKDAWDALSMREKAAMLKVAVRNGITSLQDIREKYNEFAEGGDMENQYSAGNLVNAIYENSSSEEFLGEPGHHYDFTQSDAWADAHGYYPDSRGHRDDRVKKPSHPTHPSRGSFDGLFKFNLTDRGMENPNYTLFGMVDGGQDSQATLYYKDSIVLPELTVTPKSNYIFNPYDNIRINFANGGHLYGGTSEKSQKVERKGGYVPSDAIRKRIAGYEGKAMTGAIDPLSGRYARNNSFESEAKGFYNALPESIRERVLSNPELADNLYSYSYNVGAGNFKDRVVPALERYYAGTGSADDVASSMWASGDRKLRGLRLRREQERNGVLSALWDQQMGELNQMIDNPQAAPEQPAFMPYDLGNLFPVVPASDAEGGVQMPSEAELRRQQRDAERQERRDRLQNMMDALNMVYGGSPDNPMGSSGIFGPIGALMYDDGGRIHIKPENKGKFTALKERTGHSATWFKENGTPAQKKMATFALNARHWKHGEGGNLFDTGGDTGDGPNIFRRPDGSYFYSADGTETDVTPINTLGDNPAYWTYTDAAGKTYTPKATPERHDTLTEAEIVEQRLRDSQIESNDNIWIEGNPTIPRKNGNPHLEEKAVSGAGHAAGWMKDHPVLNDWGLALGAAPFAVAAYPFAAAAGSGVTALGDAAAATTVGQGITNFLAPVATSTIAGAPALEWANVGLTSGFGAHGVQTAIDEGGVSPMTALELAPMLQVAKPMVNEATLAVENYRYPLGRPQVPEGYLTIKPQTRTRVGDVEIDNPNLLYHLDRGDGSGAFSNQGAYVADGFLMPGTPKDASAVPYSWWNKGKPYATHVGETPMTRMMTATEDTPGMLHVKSQNYPIGQWNGRRGLVLNSEYVNPEGVNVSRSTYTLDPDYGWRRVFAEDTPTAEWAEATAPRITPENATSITPAQWTAAQDAAIARGDMVEAQRLRDLHFKVSAPDTKINTKVYHGNRTDNHITAFDKSKIGSEHKDIGLDGFWFIDNPEIAKWEYALKPESRGKGIKGAKFGEVIPAYLNLENPAKLEQLGLRVVNSPYGDYPIADESLLDLFNRAKLAGKDKDGFILKLKDSDGFADPMYESIQNQFVIKNPNNIKSADAVTYDNNGVRIPLGERDNFGKNDIRYGWSWGKEPKGTLVEDFTDFNTMVERMNFPVEYVGKNPFKDDKMTGFRKWALDNGASPDRIMKVENKFSKDNWKALKEYRKVDSDASAGGIGGVQIYKNTPYFNQIFPHEVEHRLLAELFGEERASISVKEVTKAFKDGIWKIPKGDKSGEMYFQEHNFEELLPRFTQIKNALGIKEFRALTEAELRKAYQMFRSGSKKIADNNMKEFFENIKDWKAAAKLSGKALSGVGIGTITYKSLGNGEEVQDYK